MDDLTSDVEALQTNSRQLARMLSAMDVMAGLALEGEEEARDALPALVRRVRDDVDRHVEEQARFFRKAYHRRVPTLRVLAERYIAQHGAGRRWLDTRCADATLERMPADGLAKRARELVCHARVHLAADGMVRSLWCARQVEERASAAA